MPCVSCFLFAQSTVELLVFFFHLLSLVYFLYPKWLHQTTYGFIYISPEQNANENFESTTDAVSI